MERKKLILPFLKALFSQPSVILKSLYHGMVEHESKHLVASINGNNNVLRELSIFDLFVDFNEIIDPYSHLYGSSLPIDIAILNKITKEFPNCDYLEIGSWRGESLANIAPNCNRCVSLSLSEKEMRELKIDDRTIQMQRFFSKKHQNIEHIGADSTKFDFSTLGKFDVIFIDGDHRYEAVKSDTENALKLLKNENSIILWHDYTKNYEQINWEVYAGILAGMPKNLHSRIYHITNSLLAIYTNKALSNSEYLFPKIPDKVFSININSKKI